MFQLDDKFLQDIGLNEMPEEQKKPFLQHIYSELELRVGTKLSEGMSDEQLEEFEAIIDRKQSTIDDWLSKNSPDYKTENAFKKIKESLKVDENDPSLVAEYAASKWLEVNRPDYRAVVASVLDEIKREVMSSRDIILGNEDPAQQ